MQNGKVISQKMQNGKVIS